MGLLEAKQYSSKAVEKSEGKGVVVAPVRRSRQRDPAAPVIAKSNNSEQVVIWPHGGGL